MRCGQARGYEKRARMLGAGRAGLVFDHLEARRCLPARQSRKPMRARLSLQKLPLSSVPGIDYSLDGCPISIQKPSELCEGRVGSDGSLKLRVPSGRHLDGIPKLLPHDLSADRLDENMLRRTLQEVQQFVKKRSRPSCAVSWSCCSCSRQSSRKCCSVWRSPLGRAPRICLPTKNRPTTAANAAISCPAAAATWAASSFVIS